MPYHLVKLQKKSLEWRPRARCTKFWAQLAIKMLHFGVKKLFHIIHYCHLCLLMVPYYVKKTFNKTFGWIPRCTGLWTEFGINVTTQKRENSTILRRRYKRKRRNTGERVQINMDTSKRMLLERQRGKKTNMTAKGKCIVKYTKIKTRSAILVPIYVLILYFFLYYSAVFIQYYHQYFM